MGLSRRRKKDLEHLALLKLVSVCIQLNLYVYLEPTYKTIRTPVPLLRGRIIFLKLLTRKSSEASMKSNFTAM